MILKNPLNFLALLLTFWSVQTHAQQQDLIHYIPNYSTPPLEIKVKLHVFQYSKDEPKNYTIADTTVLKEQIDLINSFYGFLEPPTLKTEHHVEFIADAKIKFIVCGIHFYIDSLLWDRISYSPFLDGKFPLKIDSVNYAHNLVILNENYWSRFRAGGDLALVNDANEVKKFKIDTSYFDKASKRTFIYIDGQLPQLHSNDAITFYRENNANCSSDIWENVLGSDKNYLHIIYTGSSLKPMALGCGPSPYFLNVSNFTAGGYWANAQLAAHELGHCIGLRHTDYPQFDDLPKSDKFGFIDCDSIEVSNNIMGYNKCRRYLSPKQIAYVHMLYTTDPNRITTTTFCDYDASKSIIVNRSAEWHAAKITQGDVVIKKGRTLVIHGMVSLPQKGRLIIEDGAKVIVDGGKITNSCGEQWAGIFYCKKYKRNGKKIKPPKKKGKIEFINNGKLERVKD